jgi:hypothetical protein
MIGNGIDAEKAAIDTMAAMKKLVDLIVKETKCTRIDGIIKAKARVMGSPLGTCINSTHLVVMAGCSEIQEMYYVDQDTIQRTPALKALISAIVELQGIPQVTVRTALRLVRLLRNRGQAEGWAMPCNGHGSIVSRGVIARITVMTVVDDGSCDESDLYDTTTAKNMAAAFDSLDSLMGMY